jgi:large subunit ribosomal protein L9
MRLILRENVQNLGKIGDIVTVADGYGRNFLLPRNLAMLANERNVKELEHLRRIAEARLEHARVESLSVADRMRGQRITVKKHAGEDGRLFGSVTPREIVDLLAERDFIVDRRDLSVKEPIKALGTFEVEVKLHQAVSSTFTLIVEAHEVEKVVEHVVAEEDDGYGDTYGDGYGDYN